MLDTLMSPFRSKSPEQIEREKEEERKKKAAAEAARKAKAESDVSSGKNVNVQDLSDALHKANKEKKKALEY